jgi:predicted aspartyl protease
MIQHAMRLLLLLALGACAAATTTSPPPSATKPSPDVATVPLELEGNRPFVELVFKMPNGSTRSARFLVDSGGGGFLIVEPLAKELGLALGETKQEEGETFAQVTSPVSVWIGSVELELNPQRTLVVVGKTNMVPATAPGHADGLLPGHVLAKYHVVFDYPAAKFTIAKPGALSSRGTPLAMPVGHDSGFPRTEIVVDGKPYGMLLDTGASFTMVSQAVLASWGHAHPEWERHDGAHGEAATLGGQTLETMYLPQALWGTAELARFGVTSQREGVFEKWMSSMTAEPIVGSLAGNVLKQFRVDLDYPNEKLYLSK